jgi:enolase
MARIKRINARRILNSRAQHTLEVTVEAGDATGVASVPAGASVGSHEARSIRADKAIANVNTRIAPLLRGMDAADQGAIDSKMIKADGTKNKSRLGGNAVLGVSLACARAGAQASEQELHEYITDLWGIKAPKLPTPFMNILNGGVHAPGKLAIQEFMVAPVGAKSFSDAMDTGVKVYEALKKVLSRKYTKSATHVGDEGGFAPPARRTHEALGCIMKALDASGCGASIAMDSAASEFYKGRVYHIDGKTLSRAGLLKFYECLVGDYPIVSLEDPFAESDWQGFAAITKSLGQDIQIIGDDIFATDVRRVAQGVKRGAANCMLLKPNQIGTLTESLKAAAFCLDNDYNVMVSHRSGETNDSFIADLAVGIGCGQIKSGAPCRGERVAKYNRLLEIEESGILS